MGIKEKKEQAIDQSIHNHDDLSNQKNGFNTEKTELKSIR